MSRELKEIAKELLFMPRDELIKLLLSVQQENNQLKERVSYLERSNNRREETILDLREECGIVDELRNWLEEWLKITERQYDELNEPARKSYLKVTIDTLNEVLSKLNELEGKNE